MKFLACLIGLVSITSTFAQNLKPDELMKTYQPMTTEALSSFKAIEGINWQLKHNVESVRMLHDDNLNLVEVRRPYGFAKYLKFKIEKENREYQFGMIGGTWIGSDTMLSSHGGGYANPIPVKKMGYKSAGTSISYFFWAREDYFTVKEARRMWTDLFHPAVETAKSVQELDKILSQDPACKSAAASSYLSVVDICAIKNQVRFDYLIIDINTEDLSSITVRGRTLNQAKDVFNLKMKQKIQ